VLGYFIILAWITKFINDIRKTSATLDRIGENHYRTKVKTRRRDEMGELVANIENMRLKIIENERMRQEIIQGVSHDLKTPIALISSYAEAYEDGMCEAGEMAQIAKKETRRLNAKVTKLLNLTRLGYIDKNPKTIKKIDMKKLIGELIDLYNFQEKIKIETDLCQCEFMGDRESWFIAIQNIFDNAMRYAKSKILISLKPDSLTIANDGKPIDDRVFPSIFEAFEKGTDGNFGIGLSIVKRTVEMFGYHIKAENIPEGVSFTIFKQEK
jgi:two-component system sensor histidine kinase CssS